MPRNLKLLVLAVLVLAAAAVAATGRAQQPAANVADDPSAPLVYVFSVDALAGDRVDQGRAPFLGRLLLGQEGNQATYYRESRSVMVAETNPNHTAMATGAFGDRSGVPGNAFAVYDAAGKRDCAEADPNAPGPADTDGERAGCLLAESFFAAVKRQRGARALTSAGIFGKPKLAKLFSTKRITPGAYDADYLWTPCESQTSSDAEFCRDVPVNPATDYALDDSVVMDEVLRSVREGVPAGGSTRRPNLTFVNFPQVDSVGHGTGARTEYEVAVAQMDEQLRRFVAQQKQLGLWERTVLFVVSDHSMDTTLAKTSLSQRFTAAGIADGYQVIQNGSVDMVYLEDRESPDRFELLRKLRAAAQEAANVDEALYREPNPLDGGDRNTLDAVHPGWRLAGPRTGDLVVTQKTGGAFSDPVNPLVGNHGSPLTTDNTFAIIGGGGLVRQQSIGGTAGARFDDTLVNPGSAQNVDVAPTVMALLGGSPPADSEGRVLTEAFEPAAFARLAPAPVAGAAPAGAACAIASGFRTIAVRPRRRGLRVSFARRTTNPVQVDVFQQSRGRQIFGNRLVARFTRRSGPLVWSGRGNRRRLSDGVFLVRVRVRTTSGRVDDRRYVLQRVRGRFRSRPASERPPTCALVQSAKLSRPVFGGRSNRALNATFRVGEQARVSVDVLRGGRVVRRLGSTTRQAGVTHRVRLGSERLRRGDHVVRVTATAGTRRQVVRLTARRL